jgi:hypothetical protein
MRIAVGPTPIRVCLTMQQPFAGKGFYFLNLSCREEQDKGRKGKGREGEIKLQTSTAINEVGHDRCFSLCQLAFHHRHNSWSGNLQIIGTIK